MIDNTNTILLAESGDLEVYEGKEPAKTIPVQYIECCFNPTKYGSCCGNGIPTWKEDHNPEYYQWQSTKKVVKMAEGEKRKLAEYLDNIGKFPIDFPIIQAIDVSDIVTEKDGLYYFSPPVDKEEETQDEMWMKVINDPEWFNMKTTTKETLKHFTSKFTLKRR